MPGLVGLSDFRDGPKLRKRGPMHQDASELELILRTHNLVALNTWDPSHGPTFESPLGTSRIDYIVTRAKQVDSIAKRCCALDSFPLNALAGSRHHPVLGSINHRWNRVQMSMPKNATYMQRIRCTDAYHADSSTWQSFHLDMSNLLEAQSDLPDDTSLMQMHTQALDLFKKHFDTPSTRSAPWELTCHKTQETWNLLKLIKQEHRTDLSSLFRTWARITAFRQACHRHKKACHEVRKARIDAMLMQAREAADVHNSHKLYRLTRTLSPKTKNRKT